MNPTTLPSQTSDRPPTQLASTRKADFLPVEAAEQSGYIERNIEILGQRYNAEFEGRYRYKKVLGSDAIEVSLLEGSLDLGDGSEFSGTYSNNLPLKGAARNFPLPYRKSRQKMLFTGRMEKGLPVEGEATLPLEADFSLYLLGKTLGVKSKKAVHSVSTKRQFEMEEERLGEEARYKTGTLSYNEARLFESKEEMRELRPLQWRGTFDPTGAPAKGILFKNGRIIAEVDEFCAGAILEGRVYCVFSTQVVDRYSLEVKGTYQEIDCLFSGDIRGGKAMGGVAYFPLDGDTLILGERSTLHTQSGKYDSGLTPTKLILEGDLTYSVTPLIWAFNVFDLDNENPGKIRTPLMDIEIDDSFSSRGNGKLGIAKAVKRHEHGTHCLEGQYTWKSTATKSPERRIPKCSVTLSPGETIEVPETPWARYVLELIRELDASKPPIDTVEYSNYQMGRWTRLRELNPSSPSFASNSLTQQILCETTFDEDSFGLVETFKDEQGIPILTLINIDGDLVRVIRPGEPDLICQRADKKTFDTELYKILVNADNMIGAPKETPLPQPSLTPEQRPPVPHALKAPSKVSAAREEVSPEEALLRKYGPSVRIERDPKKGKDYGRIVAEGSGAVHFEGTIRGSFLHEGTCNNLQLHYLGITYLFTGTWSSGAIGQGELRSLDGSEHFKGSFEESSDPLPYDGVCTHFPVATPLGGNPSAGILCSGKFTGELKQRQPSNGEIHWDSSMSFQGNFTKFGGPLDGVVANMPIQVLGKAAFFHGELRGGKMRRGNINGGDVHFTGEVGRTGTLITPDWTFEGSFTDGIQPRKGTLTMRDGQKMRGEFDEHLAFIDSGPSENPLTESRRALHDAVLLLADGIPAEDPLLIALTEAYLASVRDLVREATTSDTVASTRIEQKG